MRPPLFAKVFDASKWNDKLADNPERTSCRLFISFNRTEDDSKKFWSQSCTGRRRRNRLGRHHAPGALWKSWMRPVDFSLRCSHWSWSQCWRLRPVWQIQMGLWSLMPIKNPSSKRPKQKINRASQVSRANINRQNSAKIWLIFFNLNLKRRFLDLSILPIVILTSN